MLHELDGVDETDAECHDFLEEGFVSLEESRETDDLTFEIMDAARDRPRASEEVRDEVMSFIDKRKNKKSAKMCSR